MVTFDESLEKVYEDEKAWVYFEGEEGSENSIGVYRRCQECARYISKGDLLMNLNGDVKFENWICKVHGEQQPYFDRGC